MRDEGKPTRRLLVAGAAVSVFALSGCSPSARKLAITVYKDAGCGCCNAWIAGLEREGFTVKAEDRADLQDLKLELGVPADLAACHTGVIDRYVVEGHVPAADIKRLLAEKPAGHGLSVPGMPIGSPGMEVAGQPAEAYTVWLFAKDGKRTAFAQHGG